MCRWFLLGHPGCTRVYVNIYMYANMYLYNCGFLLPNAYTYIYIFIFIINKCNYIINISVCVKNRQIHPFWTFFGNIPTLFSSPKFTEKKFPPPQQAIYPHQAWCFQSFVFHVILWQKTSTKGLWEVVIGVKLVDQQLLGGKKGWGLTNSRDLRTRSSKWRINHPCLGQSGGFIFNIWGRCAGFLIACMLAKVFRYQATALMFWSQKLIQNGDTLQHLIFPPENHLKHTPSCRCLFGFPLQQSDQWLLIE